jgi:[acyl-carrier-protein] S-malonyltransferase
MMTAYDGAPGLRDTFDEASEALAVDLWSLVSIGPAEELNQTVNTQPVMLTAGIALLRAWRAAGGPEPELVAGHSLGEYTALVAADALRFGDALRLVRFRAQVMQEAVPEGTGGIAAILGLDDEAIQATCAEAGQGQVLEAANFNAPGQVVIAGHREAVERGMAVAKKRGAKRAVMLSMSVPSHCSLMRGAAERLAERLAGLSLQAPRIEVLNNVDVAALKDPSAIRDGLVRQLYNPVQWVRTVRELHRRGAMRVIECGPGGVLTTLNKRSAPDLEALALKDKDQLAQLAAEMAQE